MSVCVRLPVRARARVGVGVRCATKVVRDEKKNPSDRERFLPAAHARFEDGAREGGGGGRDMKHEIFRDMLTAVKAIRDGILQLVRTAALRSGTAVHLHIILDFFCFFDRAFFVFFSPCFLSPQRT